MVSLAQLDPEIEVKVFYRKYLGKGRYAKERSMSAMDESRSGSPDLIIEGHFDWQNGKGKISHPLLETLFRIETCGDNHHSEHGRTDAE